MRIYIAHSVFMLGIIALMARPGNCDWVPTNGPYGANVEALDIIGSKLFAGTFSGGVYLSADNGNMWKESNSGITNVYMRALGAFDGVVLTGTDGNGIFRSIDSGANWVISNTGLSSGYITSFATNGSTIYAGTYGGIFRSTDKGVHWNAVDTNFKKIMVYSLAIDGNTIFAGTGDSGIIRSTDNGVTWRFINPEPEYQMIGVEVVATNGTTVFAARNYSTSTTIYRSIDKGTTWSKLYSKGNNTFVNSFAFSSTTVFAATTIGVLMSTDNGTTWNKTNTGLSDTVVQTLKINGNTIFAGTENGGVFRTTNNGGNWTSVNTGLTNMNLKVWAAKSKILFAMAGGSEGFRSTDNGKNWTPVFIVPSNPYCFSFLENGDTIFTGTRLGAYFSSDTGNHWTPVNFSVENTSVQSLVKSSNNIFMGTSRGVFVSGNGGSSWKLIGLGDIFDLSVTSLLMCGDDLLAATSKHGIFRLKKSDTTWSSVNTGLINKDLTCLALCGNTVLSGSYNGIFRSRDKGMTWTDTIKTLSGVNSFLVLDTAILASGSGVFCSKDTGKTWTKVTTGLPTATANSTISSITVCGDNLFAGVAAKSVWKRPLQEILNLPKVNVRKELRNLSSNSFSINAVSGRKISFEFCLDQPGKVWCAVYDLSGRLVSVIIDQALAAGLHNQTRDARSMSKGCYLVRFQASGVSEVRMVRLLE